MLTIGQLSGASGKLERQKKRESFTTLSRIHPKWQQWTFVGLSTFATGVYSKPHLPVQWVKLEVTSMTCFDHDLQWLRKAAWLQIFRLHCRGTLSSPPSVPAYFSLPIYSALYHYLRTYIFSHSSMCKSLQGPLNKSRVHPFALLIGFFYHLYLGSSYFPLFTSMNPLQSSGLGSCINHGTRSPTHL